MITINCTNMNSNAKETHLVSLVRKVIKWLYTQVQKMKTMSYHKYSNILY